LLEDVAQRDSETRCRCGVGEIDEAASNEQLRLGGVIHDGPERVFGGDCLLVGALQRLLPNAELTEEIPDDAPEVLEFLGETLVDHERLLRRRALDGTISLVTHVANERLDRTSDESLEG
jgi:hypothetical protein